MSTFGHFFGVLIVRRDTGKTQKLIKIFEMTCAHSEDVSDEKRACHPRACREIPQWNVNATSVTQVRNGVGAGDLTTLRKLCPTSDQMRSPSHSLGMTTVIA